MQAYVADLINYLADSFEARRKLIRIEQLVEPLRLDITQAVPLGLILDDSITNAIKYEFGQEVGNFIIAASLIKNEELVFNHCR